MPVRYEKFDSKLQPAPPAPFFDPRQPVLLALVSVIDYLTGFEISFQGIRI
jgi:hypothetical protein